MLVHVISFEAMLGYNRTVLARLGLDITG